MSEYFDTRYLRSWSVANSLPLAICHLIVLSEYKDSSNTKNPVLNSIINYQFVPNADDAGDIAVDNAIARF